MRRSACIVVLTAISACGRVQSAPVPAPAIWLLSSPTLAGDSASSVAQGGLVRLDTASIRPILAIGGSTADVPSTVATFTTYQGTRYHADMIRAVTEDSAVIRPFSRAVVTASMSAGKGLLVDAQEMGVSDLQRFLRLLRELADAARERGRTPFGVIVPAGDTLAYPTLDLARAADVIVVRFLTGRALTTVPSAPITPDRVRRELGLRSNGLGASRLVAELPLFGFLWSRTGEARSITYREANMLVIQEAGSFRRDPTSGYLTGTLHDGSTIWVPDAETIRTLIAAAQSRGVNTIGLSGIAGADPALMPRGDFKR